MNLREVREAASQHLWHHDPSVVVMAEHIFATIDPEPESPITADWLREVWGFEKAEWSKIAYENGHGSMVKVNDDCWHYEDDNFEWPHDLHTRQQFCDLAKALGIPRKDGAK